MRNFQLEKDRLFAFLQNNAHVQDSMQRIAASHPPSLSIHSVGVTPPKTIWLFWAQGQENAPEIVKQCILSWKIHHKDYNINVLNEDDAIKEFPDLAIGKNYMSLAGLSDRLRAKLLSRHGGIWADATLFCSGNITHIVNLLTQMTGFFAFARPAPDRQIGSWFLAAIPNSPVCSAWDAILSSYSNEIEKEKINTHAYFFFHYIYEYIQSIELYKQYHSSMPCVLVDGASRLIHKAALFGENSDKDKINFNQNDVEYILHEYPVHKLTWKGAVSAELPAAKKLTQILIEYNNRKMSTS